MFIPLLIRFAACAITVFAFSGAQAQTAKPIDLKVGITAFLTGSGSVLGMPAKIAAEMYIEEMNAAGGINGVRISPIFIDEGVGTDKMLSEYRRAVQEQGARVMLASTSSGSCNTLAPVAEDLKVVNIMWDCGTEKLLEDRRYKYVVRTQANATTETVAAVLYLLRIKPDFKSIAVVNQDYSWGRDSWELFSSTLKALKPDVKVVAELFPKFGATDFSTEISRLQALRPDVVVSSSWGGDLDTFLRQSAQRGLMKNSLFVLPLAESSLERLGSTLPDGVIIGARGDHYFLHPELKDDPKLKNFVHKFKAKVGSYPSYTVFHMIQALEALKAGYDRAIKVNMGKWPTNEQLADAMHNIEFRGVTRSVKMREDGQGLEDQLLGVTKKVGGYPFPVLDKMAIYPAHLVTAPVGQKSLDWVKTLKPEMINSPHIRAFSTSEN
ncbi:ABC transporter substrate-binding protein [Noviherbaspirillum denitrificans]|uniref:Branched-chain amino acid ABC transporter substrate-binding protein n=1 Tax=Noviherbaspirillum denitrificans TaxID=1968433 RepID=A0A254TDX1_9BURK|nr:ABC transporter substrate-binding protein [Noviherbaspirillum denitrificans]OWW20735.1 branched-chain amino acid ABC transporter substrate-binding protein [Noviherbaspirillum denitrificans]